MGVNELKHHGILGMRWGVRRQRGPDGLVTSRASSGSEDYKTARELKSKGSRNLSTNELQTLTRRLNLEKQYNELTPSSYQKGEKKVKAILAAGTTAASAYTLYKSPFGQSVKTAIVNAARFTSEAEKMKWLV